MRTNRLIHRATILRKQQIEGKGITSKFQVIQDEVPCLVVPTSPRDALNRNLSVGKEYSVFFNDNQDLKKGDRIEALNLNLSVAGIAEYKHIPRIGHLQAVCETIE